MSKRVLITGASSGIGEFLGRRLANEGSMVYLIGRNRLRLDTIKMELEAHGSKCWTETADVRNSEDTQTVFDNAVSAMGGVDVLVANAGTGRFKNLEEMTDEDYEIQFDTNVKGVFNYVRLAVKTMKSQNSGQIVVTSSNLGFKTTARGSIYCATKFAIQGMIGSLREELKGTNIKAGTLNPGSVDTPWFSDYSPDQNKEHRIGVEEVVDGAMLMINQGPRSNIDHILIHPANPKG